MDLVKELQELCKQNGVSFHRLGKLTGITPHAFWNWKYGKNQPTLTVYLIALKVFGKTLKIVDMEEEPT